MVCPGHEQREDGASKQSSQGDEDPVEGHRAASVWHQEGTDDGDHDSVDEEGQVGSNSAPADQWDKYQAADALGCIVGGEKQ